MTVEHWIVQARRGDPAAFNHLAGRFQSVAYHVAFHHVGDHDDAWDACQEAFLSAWRAMGRFEGDAAGFRSWLMRIVVNACRDRQRYEARRPSTSLDRDPDGEPRHLPLPDPGQSPEEYAANADLRALLDAAMALLSHEHREVLLLDQAGFSYEEIAYTVGVELGTVKSRLSRGRARMRGLLTGAAEGEPGTVGRRSERERASRESSPPPIQRGPRGDTTPGADGP